ncbi:CHAT domain-containing protein [Laspinema palackyanum]|uniref:CHAT domain-containing protein n=1 Tax=Laspinema palackyanum TaxID=3231601 RepID=UPI00345C7B80|nr:CHAT domain-containing protein [Laspinema sp. D2c]
MNERRIQAYRNLIQQLLTCPNGEEDQILNQAIELVDEGFMQACQLRAQQLQQEGEENQAQFLRDVAQQVVAFLDQQPSGGGGESRETQGHATAEDYFNFLMQILQAIQDSQSSPSVVYPLLQQNLDKLDVNLIQILNNWASKTLNQIEENQAASIAADIGDFATLIQEFPLGNPINNQEIAVVGYEISLTVFTREQAPERWASLQNNLGNVYLNCIQREPRQNLELAFNCYQAALEVFTPNTFLEKWAETQNNLGNAYLNRIQGEKRQNLELAITCYQDALRVYTQDAFPEKWAGTQNNLGTAYNNRIQGERGQNLELAISYFKAALQVRTPNTFLEKWAETQNNLGNAYLNRIQGEKRQNLELAITCYQDALRVYTQDAFPEKWAGTQNNLGTAYGDRIEGEKRQNLELAIACYQDALQVRTRRDAFPEDWVMMSLNNLGNTYNNRIEGEKRQNLELAIACYQDALQIFTRDAFPQDWAMTQNNLGNTYRNLIQGERRQNLELAIASFQAALQVYTQESFPQNHAETLFNLGLAYRDSSQVQNAYKTFVAAIDTVEEIRSGIIIGGEADKQKLAEEWQKLYGNMVEVCLELENYSAALEYAERSKARNLLELMAATRLKPPGVSSEVWERYDALSQELWNLQQQSDNSTFSTLSKTEIIQQSKKLHQEIDTLVEEEITPHNPKFRLGQQVQPMPYREIQALVDDNRAIVEWYFTNKGIHAFIVTRQGEPILVSTEPDAWEGLVQLTSEYVIAYYNTDKSQWRQQLPSYLQRLAEILELDKLLSRIPSHCQELVLVPYRFLHLFPLHALPVSQTEYLSDKFPQGIRYVPSSQILQLSLSQESTPLGKGGEEKSLFAIQNPTADLDYTNIEVEAIQTGFNAVTVLKGDAASKTGFNQAATLLKDAAFVHFACHGSFDFANPRNSGLILADAKLSETTATEEGVPRIRSQRGEFNPSECLTLPEIFNLRFRQCRLVALSACETGITDIRTTSDEYISILAGFFFAGSRNVLGTLWAVNDLSTAIFMIHFYETLLGENQPPVALAVKQTQEWMQQVTVAQLLEWIVGCPLIGGERREEMCYYLRLGYKTKLDVKRFESPYYWAAFCAVGQ